MKLAVSLSNASLSNLYCCCTLNKVVLLGFFSFSFFKSVNASFSVLWIRQPRMWKHLAEIPSNSNTLQLLMKGFCDSQISVALKNVEDEQLERKKVLFWVTVSEVCLNKAFYCSLRISYTYAMYLVLSHPHQTLTGSPFLTPPPAARTHCIFYNSLNLISAGHIHSNVRPFPRAWSTCHGPHT